MTREELEKGRRLLGAYDAALFRASHGSLVGLSDGARALTEWLLDHAPKLLSLAEEARWREVETELPEGDGYVFATEPSGMVNVRLFYDGRWASNKEKPTHWRPLPLLPRGPVKP